jgi:hypothetical protein
MENVDHLADCLKANYKTQLEQRDLDDNLEQLCWIYYKMINERINPKELIIQLILEDDPTGKWDESKGGE